MKRIEWSRFQPEDWPWVLAMHIEQERKLGREMDLPNLMERPVISCFVGRRNGTITNCVFLEAEVEACALGDRPLSKTELNDVVNQLMGDAQFYDIRLARAFVPAQALDTRGKKPCAIRRILKAAKFHEVGESMVEFYRWIPQRGGY